MNQRADCLIFFSLESVSVVCTGAWKVGLKWKLELKFLWCIFVCFVAGRFNGVGSGFEVGH